MSCPVCANPTCIEDHFTVKDNKCPTCKHRNSYIEQVVNRECQTCVGFKNYEIKITLRKPDFPKLEEVSLSGRMPRQVMAEQSVAEPKPANYWLKFLPIVKAVAELSKDPSTKVGCIALDGSRNIVATGYNGFPRGVNDDPARYSDRPTKYKLISHAEQNVVAQAALAGRSLAGTTVILSALYPCSSCAKSLIQAGVKRVISPRPDTDPKWEEEAKWAQLMFAEAGVEVIHY